MHAFVLSRSVKISKLSRDALPSENTFLKVYVYCITKTSFVAQAFFIETTGSQDGSAHAACT